MDFFRYFLAYIVQVIIWVFSESFYW